MLETSTNGAGRDRARAAAAGPGQAGVPDPELVEQAKRRSLTANYKLEVPAEADASTRPGEVGELLRREGLYTSHLTYAWCLAVHVFLPSRNTCP